MILEVNFSFDFFLKEYGWYCYYTKDSTCKRLIRKKVNDCTCFFADAESEEYSQNNIFTYCFLIKDKEMLRKKIKQIESIIKRDCIEKYCFSIYTEDFFETYDTLKEIKKNIDFFDTFEDDRDYFLQDNEKLNINDYVRCLNRRNKNSYKEGVETLKDLILRQTVGPFKDMSMFNQDEDKKYFLLESYLYYIKYKTGNYDID